MSPDPKIFSKQRMLDPQQWNMYAYVRNNPMIAIDPDGREMKIILLNSAGYSGKTMDALSKNLQGTFTKAGVLNVSVEVINSPTRWQAIKADLASVADSHTTTVELAAGSGKEKGLVSLDPATSNTQELGKEMGEIPGHGMSAVNGPAAIKGAENGDDNVSALAGPTKHEIGHEAGLGHNNDSQVMQEDFDKRDLNNPNLQFTPAEQKQLQQQFNRKDEKQQ